MNYIKKNKYITKQDVKIVGGKAASLGEMTQFGISVPDGFVIVADAFEEFLIQNDLQNQIKSILNKVDLDNTNSIGKASKNIKQMILNYQIPENIVKQIENAYQEFNMNYVAVRSSATVEDGSIAAWAGQLDTFLNTDKDKLIDNTKKCWASLFSSRAISYSLQKGFDLNSIFVAVIIQNMIQSEKSGVVFSVHPVTQDQNQMIIEASYGLGEAIVSGQVTPDSYVIDKKLKQIISQNISKQQKGLFKAETGNNEWKDISIELAKQSVLNEQQILRLANIVIKIEQHYGFPVDVEWAWENNRFYITQSRPITTLKN